MRSITTRLTEIDVRQIYTKCHAHCAGNFLLHVIVFSAASVCVFACLVRTLTFECFGQVYVHLQNIYAKVEYQLSRS